MKKRLTLVMMVMLASGSLWAENKIRLQIEGPEESYNLIRVTNRTQYTDFSCLVYLLQDVDGKKNVQSTLGSFFLKGFDDTDSYKVRTYRDQWLGVKIPDELINVEISLCYKDLPLFDIVEIIISEVKDSKITVGEEF